MSEPAQAAAASNAASPEGDQGAKKKADLKQQKMKYTRLILYVNRAKDQMYQNFYVKHQCMGLHFGFGDNETTRLQKAMERHGRHDQFDTLSVPVDVLLRMLSFVPQYYDPRVRRELDKRWEPKEQEMIRDVSTGSEPPDMNPNVKKAEKAFKDREGSMIRKTMYRLLATCSTLLYVISENKCVLGAKVPPKECREAAMNAYKIWKNNQKLAAAAAQGRSTDDDDTTTTCTDDAFLDDLRDEIELHKRANPFSDDTDNNIVLQVADDDDDDDSDVSELGF